MITHAAGHSACRHTLPKDTHAVVLTVPDETAMLLLARNLEAARVLAYLIREPDPPYNNQAMAMGVVPCRRETVRSVLKRLPLYGRNP